MPWTQADVNWVAARLLPDVYDINARWKYDRNTRRLEALYAELEPMKFKITEPTFFLHKRREPGETLDFPVGPHKNTVVGGHGLVRVPQFEEIRDEKPQMSITGLQGGVLKAKLSEIKQNAQKRLADGIAKIEDAHTSGLARVDAEMDGVVKKINKEIDDQLQEFAEFTNGGPPL
jgi:hypothetical protein